MPEDHNFDPSTIIPDTTSQEQLVLSDIERRLNEASQDTGERMLGWFCFGHLPLKLQRVSAAFAECAVKVVRMTPGSAERTVALRKLLEGKDAAVRAAL